MTGRSFQQWRMRHAWTIAQAAEKLGVHRNTAASYERLQDAKVPKHIALACAAISYGLDPMP